MIPSGYCAVRMFSAVHKRCFKPSLIPVDLGEVVSFEFYFSSNIKSTLQPSCISPLEQATDFQAFLLSNRFAPDHYQEFFWRFFTRTVPWRIRGVGPCLVATQKHTSHQGGGFGCWRPFRYLQVIVHDSIPCKSPCVRYLGVCGFHLYNNFSFSVRNLSEVIRFKEYFMVWGRVL